MPASGETAEGWPIYERPAGYLFSLVVEAKPGPSRRPAGAGAFSHDPDDPTVRPDLEVIVSRPLGDGSSAVCDNTLPEIGGVPASASFDLSQPISDAINDLACRFVNGSGVPVGRGPNEACTLFDTGEYRFVEKGTTVQFCGRVTQPFGFPIGDTVVTVRVRDLSDRPGPPASLVVRVSP